MFIERRQHERIECYIIARQSKYAREETDFFGTVRNISVGGAMIETDERLYVGSLLELAFSLEEDRQLWEAKGQVVWARRQDGKTYLGLEFSQPLEEHWEDTLK